MSCTAVTAAARGLVFTQSLLFLMAVSSDESGTHEGVRQELASAYPILSSLSFKLTKRKKSTDILNLEEKYIFTNPTYAALFSHYRPRNKRWANIGMWVTCCAQREMSGRRKATKSARVIIIFIILVGEMTEASESSISFSAQRGFKLDIPDRNSYIMSHVYIKHGFT